MKNLQRDRLPTDDPRVFPGDLNSRVGPITRLLKIPTISVDIS